MICQECGMRPATLHFTKIVNGQKTEFHLCDACAKEKGDLIPGTDNAFSIHNLLSGLLNFDPLSPGNQQIAKPLRCNTCGLTYAQFSQSGRFGCADCYRAFESKLDPLLKRIHGNTAHAGKIPRRAGSALSLKRQLQELKRRLALKIEREEFEEAAHLRDQIRELEKRLNAQ